MKLLIFTGVLWMFYGCSEKSNVLDEPMTPSPAKHEIADRIHVGLHVYRQMRDDGNIICYENGQSDAYCFLNSDSITDVSQLYTNFRSIDKHLFSLWNEEIYCVLWSVHKPDHIPEAAYGISCIELGGLYGSEDLVSDIRMNTTARPYIEFTISNNLVLAKCFSYHLGMVECIWIKQ